MPSFTGQHIGLTLVYFFVTIYVSSWPVCVVVGCNHIISYETSVFHCHFQLYFHWKITDQIKFWKLIFRVLYCWLWIKFTPFLRQRHDWFRISKLYLNENTWTLVTHVVYLTTKLEGVNLENDEIKSVLVMLMASYFLNKVTCTRNLLETYLGVMNL